MRRVDAFFIRRKGDDGERLERHLCCARKMALLVPTEKDGRIPLDSFPHLLRFQQFAFFVRLTSFYACQVCVT